MEEIQLRYLDEFGYELNPLYTQLKNLLRYWNLDVLEKSVLLSKSREKVFLVDKWRFEKTQKTDGVNILVSKYIIDNYYKK